MGTLIANLPMIKQNHDFSSKMMIGNEQLRYLEMRKNILCMCVCVVRAYTFLGAF